MQVRLDPIIDEPGWYRAARREPSAKVWGPPVDIYETAEELVIRADLPGVAKQEIKTSVENNVLSLQGEKKSGMESKERAYHRTERPSGRFSRTFAVPGDVDTQAITTAFSDGVLTIRIPKRAEAKPRTVEIS